MGSMQSTWNLLTPVLLALRNNSGSDQIENISPTYRKHCLLNFSVVAYPRNKLVLLLYGLEVHQGCLCFTVQTRHIAPYLRLFVPNNLYECHPS
jgi:hypothetical protein